MPYTRIFERKYIECITVYTVYYTSCISMVLLDHFANKSNTFQHTLSLPLSLSHFLPFPPWVSTSSDTRSQDRAINGTLLQFLQCDAKIYEFVTKDVKMIWLSSVKAWLIKPKTEVQFKFLATRNVNGWYQLSSQQVNFDRLPRLWFPFHLFIWIFGQLICLQSLI